ncbi:MAG TPA: glycosyltransferase family 39 protein [Ktedonobacteraceae bacterium]|nr:glycosyltransferase family 39 protein [Ktedonobacteraceae bacterium]
MFADTIKNDIPIEKTKQTQYHLNWQSIVFWGAVMGLVVIAIGMRLYHLGLPFDRDGYDEGVYWQTLRSMSMGNILYQQIFYSQPPFFILSTFPGYILLGSSLWSARLGIALVSLLGLPGAFLLGKALSGRLGAIAAMLLLIANPLYLTQSQTIEAEVSSTACSLLAIGLAYLWWEHPEGTRGFFYAALTGIAITLSILCKLLSASIFVPIALLMVARLWQIWHKKPGTRLIGLLPILVVITTCILTFVVFLLPFSGSYQAMLQSAITFHSAAAQTYSYSQQANISTLQNALTSLLTLTAFFGMVAALLRRDWRVVPLIAWFIATLYLLWQQVPLFQHHLIALIPPLIALSVMGIGNQSLQSKETSNNVISTATPYFTWIALALIIITALFNIQQDRLYYRTAVAKSASEFTQLESKIATDLRLDTGPNQLVVTDAQFIAGLADRNTPPALVDTSAVRITSNYLTLAQLENATSQPQVHAVLFFTGRFYLPNVAGYHSWVAQHFHLLHNYGAGKELWVR